MSRPPPVRAQRVAVVVSLLIAAGTFAFDIAAPLGVAGGMPYVAVVLPALVSPLRGHAIWAGLLGTVLTVAGYFLSPDAPAGLTDGIVLTNRVLGLMVIWVTALGIAWYRATRERLTGALLRLRDQEAMARLGEMATVIAHEVKNPLAGMRGALQVIAARLPSDATEQDVLDRIQQRIDLLHRSLEELLVFARPRDAVRESVSASDLVGDALERTRADAMWTGVRASTSVDESISLHVDPELCREALHHLLLNAAQAAGPGGAVHLTVERGDGACCIRVVDDGPGIPEDHLARVFEPFFTTRTRGPGLGLAIVKRTVEAHGGSVEVQSPAGGGTEVSVHLPLAPAAR